jgi:hypothetical protein
VRRPGTIDGLKVRVIDAPSAPAVGVDHALRLLARIMVRRYQAVGDDEAITAMAPSSSTLTVVRDSRPHHDTNEAA